MSGAVSEDVQSDSSQLRVRHHLLSWFSVEYSERQMPNEGEEGF